MAPSTRLDQTLLKKIADKRGKTPKYIREQISKSASRLGVTSEAAQVLMARELGIGTSAAFRKLPPNEQQQVRDHLPELLDNSSASTKEQKSRATSRVRDPIAVAIDFLIDDGELKSRCKDLLLKKRHLDRAIREATTVLEDRIRQLSDVSGRPNPEALVNKALNPDPKKALLLVSQVASEQAGFHSICRGIVLAFRHKAHHQLDENVSREHALKFCSFVDVLLGILAEAELRK